MGRGGRGYPTGASPEPGSAEQPSAGKETRDAAGPGEVTALEIKAVDLPVTEGLRKSKVTRTTSVAAAYHLMKIKKSN